MNTPNSNVDRLDAVLNQLEARESNSLWKRMGIVVLIVLFGATVMLLSYRFIFSQPSLRTYAALTLDDQMVSQLFEADPNPIVVKHSRLGIDTIQSMDDYQNYKELMAYVSQMGVAMQTVEVEEAENDENIYFSLDVAGDRKTGNNLQFYIEGFDTDHNFFIDFGNGYKRKTKQRFSYTYSTPGLYRLKLISISSVGDSQVYRKNLRVIRETPIEEAAETIEIASAEPIQVEDTREESVDDLPITNLEKNPGPSDLVVQDLGIEKGIAETSRLQQPEVDSDFGNSVESETGEESIPETEPEALPAKAPQAPLLLADEMPVFPGGLQGLGNYILRNCKYPRSARADEIEGTVMVRFIIDESGIANSAKILKSLSPDCDKEAIRLIKNMPRWTPARQDGQIVSVYQTIPVNFKLLK